MIDLSRDDRVRGFAVDRGPLGCLLLHGFTGTPAEMRPLADRLVARGYSVRVPLLPGHGARADDLAATRWTDWYAAAKQSWDDLGRVAPTRAAAGLSMGALLALHLAFERPEEVRAVAALAPVLALAQQRWAEVARWMRHLPRLPRRFEIVAKRNSARITPAYDEIPLRALASMADLQRRVRSELGAIRAPALVVDGGRDETISPRAAPVVESLLGSPDKRRAHFPNSGHILTEDVDADAVIDAVERFFAERLSASS